MTRTCTLLALALLVGCGETDTPSPRAAEEPDASEPRIPVNQQGNAAKDPGRDAPAGCIDCVGIQADAGAPEAPRDAGQAPRDGGAGDAGAQPIDAGASKPDAGADAGTPVLPDAGTPSTGPRPPAGFGWCDAPSVAVGSQVGNVLTACTGETLEALCEQGCRALCERWEWYCGEPCPENFCASESVMDICRDDCGVDGVECTRAFCEEGRTQTCEGTVCENDQPPTTCDSAVCTNTCEFASDDYCDDGDTLNAEYGDCAHGTDCADCGPRFDTSCLPEGEACGFSSRCCGYEQGDAWCVNLGVPSGATRCMKSCQTAADCGDGYGCIRLDVDGDPDAAACFPVCAI